MSPAIAPLRAVAVWSAELPVHKRGDPSTEGLRSSLRLGLREHSDDGLGAGWADEHAAASVELCVDLCEPVEQGLRQGPAACAGQVQLHLREALHHACSLRQRATANGRAKE